MELKQSGRTPESTDAIQELANFLERFGEAKEIQESLLTVDDREAILVAFSSQAYYARKGYYWFSLAKTKYLRLLTWSEDHAWVVLICGTHGRYFVPIAQVKALLSKMPSNRRDGRWDLYIRFEGDRAYFGVTHIENHLDVTQQLQNFEQLWERPAVEEEYADEAIYIPDSLPAPDYRSGKVIRVVRDTGQSRIVKELYAYKCQVCGWTVYSPRLRSLWYCEAHHVQPLGRKYNGPDHVSNILALCPTHHCMMDLGALAIEPLSLEVLSTSDQEPSRGQKLTLRREHGLNQKYLRFHLESIYMGNQVPGEVRLTDDYPGM
jgi:hypothetical protein